MTNQGNEYRDDVLIIIKFGELLLRISSRIINALGSYIKHSKECFIVYPNTSKLAEKTQLHLVFRTLFSVLGYLMKHSSLAAYIVRLFNSHFPLVYAPQCSTK